MLESPTVGICFQGRDDADKLVMTYVGRGNVEVSRKPTAQSCLKAEVDMKTFSCDTLAQRLMQNTRVDT